MDYNRLLENMGEIHGQDTIYLIEQLNDLGGVSFHQLEDNNLKNQLLHTNYYVKYSSNRDKIVKYKIIERMTDEFNNLLLFVENEVIHIIKD